MYPLIKCNCMYVCYSQIYETDPDVMCIKGHSAVILLYKQITAIKPSKTQTKLTTAYIIIMFEVEVIVL